MTLCHSPCRENRAYASSSAGEGKQARLAKRTADRLTAGHGLSPTVCTDRPDARRSRHLPASGKRGTALTSCSARLVRPAAPDNPERGRKSTGNRLKGPVSDRRQAGGGTYCARKKTAQRSAKFPRPLHFPPPGRKKCRFLRFSERFRAVGRRWTGLFPTFLKPEGRGTAAFLPKKTHIPATKSQFRGAKRILSGKG